MAGQRKHKKQPDRVRGAWFGFAVGDMLGSICERLGEAVPDVNSRILLARARATQKLAQESGVTLAMVAASKAYHGDDFSLERAGQAIVAHYGTNPLDADDLTVEAIRLLNSCDANYENAGDMALRRYPNTGSNGSLARALSTGIARHKANARLHSEAYQLSGITHADSYCTHACKVYTGLITDLIAGLRDQNRAMMHLTG